MSTWTDDHGRQHYSGPEGEFINFPDRGWVQIRPVSAGPPQMGPLPGGNMPTSLPWSQPQSNYQGGQLGYNPLTDTGGQSFNYGGGQQGGNPGFWQGFGGQTLINTGANLLQGWLQNRSQGQANQANQNAIEHRIRLALMQLEPAQIMAMAQQLLPQMAANANAAGQTATQAVREQAARTGQLEGPRALSFEAGTRAKLAGDVQQRAFEGAFNLAGSRASAVSGAPFVPIQPKTGYADAISNSFNQAYLVRALSQQPRYSPYRWPGQDSYFGGGTPSPQQASQAPYQWPFYGARY